MHHLKKVKFKKLNKKKMKKPIQVNIKKNDKPMIEIFTRFFVTIVLFSL